MQKINTSESGTQARFIVPQYNGREGGRQVQRFGMVLRLRPEKTEAYGEYHAAVWPEVLDMIRECNIRNYSIYLKDGYLSATSSITERT